MIPSDEARRRARALVHPNVANVRQYRGAGSAVDHNRVRAVMKSCGRGWLGWRIHYRPDLELPPAGRYGPHRPEDAPTTVTVLELVKWPQQREVRIPGALLRQREQINTHAYLSGASS